MPWSKEKNREYRSHGDGREKKRASDKAYAKSKREIIRERAINRPVAPNAPKEFRCKKCGIVKPFTPEFFQYRPAMKWKLLYQCRKCSNAATLLYMQKRNYGLTEAEIVEFRKKSCVICGSNRRISIDHCHKTNRVRDPLCSKCNTGIGQFDESPDRLRAAALYIERHSNV